MGKDSWNGVNGVPDTKNEIHAPGVSTHARSTRTLGLFLLFSYTVPPSVLKGAQSQLQVSGLQNVCVDHDSIRNRRSRASIVHVYHFGEDGMEENSISF